MQEAEKDIQNHVGFLARINTEASQRLFEKILEKISSLDFKPFRGRVIKHFNQNRRKLIVNKHFNILYTKRKNIIYIENIINNKMKM